MAYLELPIFMVKSPEMRQILQQIQLAVNVMDEHNFPHKLYAEDILAEESAVGTNLLVDYSTPLKKLRWREWPIPLVVPIQPATTTSSLDCGGFFLYDPNKFLDGSWCLEVAIKTTAGGTAIAELKDAGVTVIGTVSTSNTDWTVVRGDPLDMPTIQTPLTVTLRSSSSSYTASLWAARLIYVC